MADGISDYQKLQLLLRQQQYPTFHAGNIDSIGGGIQAAANNVMQMVMQARQQAQLQELLKAEEKRAIEARAAKIQGLAPLSQASGLPVETLMALPDAALNTITSSYMADHKSQMDMGKNAEALQRALTLQQHGLDDAGRVPMVDFIEQIPLVTQQQAADLAQLGATDELAAALANVKKFQLNGAIGDVLGLDPNTAEGQNDFQLLNGFAPKNETDLQQQSANLQGTLLDNVNQNIVNKFLPQEKTLGLQGQVLDNEGKNINNTWKPVMNAAGLENTQASTAGIKAGTLGKDLDNAGGIIDLQLKNRIVDIASQNDLPWDQKAALISAIPGADSRSILQNLKDLSGKDGILGKKPKEFQQIFDTIAKESGLPAADIAKLRPAGAAPASKPAKTRVPVTKAQAAGMVAKNFVKEAPRNLPIVGPAIRAVDTVKGLNNAVQAAPGVMGAIKTGVTGIGALGINPVGAAKQGLQNLFGEFGQGFNGQIPTPKPAPQQPVTLNGKRQAKNNANANATLANQNVQTGTQLIQQGNQAAQSAQDFLNLMQQKEQQRQKLLQQQFTF